MIDRERANERLLTAPRRNPHQSSRRQHAILASLLGLASCVAIVAFGAEVSLSEWLSHLYAQVVGLGLWAPVAVIGLFYLMTVAALPTPLLVVASGAMLGLWLGFLGIWIGYMLAVATVWVISRWLAEPLRARFTRLHPKTEPILDAIARRGGWLVFLTQLHPMSPNGVLNWLYRSLGIRAHHALPAIGLGRAPTLWLYSALGAWSIEGIGAADHGWWWLLSALVAAGILIAIARLVSRALREATQP